MFFYCFSCSNYMIFYPRSFRSILFYSVFYTHGIAAVVYIDVQWQWCTYYVFQRHSDPQGHMILCCAFDDALPGHPLLRSLMHSSPMPCSGITWFHIAPWHHGRKKPHPHEDGILRPSTDIPWWNSSVDQLVPSTSRHTTEFNNTYSTHTYMHIM